MSQLLETLVRIKRCSPAYLLKLPWPRGTKRPGPSHLKLVVVFALRVRQPKDAAMHTHCLTSTEQNTCQASEHKRSSEITLPAQLHRACNRSQALLPLIAAQPHCLTSSEQNTCQASEHKQSSEITSPAQLHRACNRPQALLPLMAAQPHCLTSLSKTLARRVNTSEAQKSCRLHSCSVHATDLKHLFLFGHSEQWPNHSLGLTARGCSDAHSRLSGRTGN
jgi:hypothetical protein